jgi:epoxyqueuosine reductase
MTSEDLISLAQEFDIDDLAAIPTGQSPVDAETLKRIVRDVPEELDYLNRGLDKRLDPTLILPGARSIFVGLVSYAGGPGRPERLPPGTAWISRYSWGGDYHKTVGERFKRLAGVLEARWGARTKWYVDTGPVLEKTWAAAAGLGFAGRNSLLVSPRFGSFVFLGCILTDLDVSNLPVRAVPAGCGDCRACVEACPTAAIKPDGSLDRSRCLGFLTVSSRHPIPEDINLAGNLYGCDICQDVCPYNHAPEIKFRQEFQPRPGMFCPAVDEIAALDEATFAARFGGTPIMRRGLDGLKQTARRIL